jgi:hypothetical protein
MKKRTMILLAVAPFLAVIAGIVAGRLAPVVMHHSAQVSDNGAPQAR